MDKFQERELNRRFGLDLPMWRQYTRYIIGDFDENGRFFCGVVCGNLGPSIQRRGRSVMNVLFSPPTGRTFWESQFGYSIRLVLLGSLIAVGLGVPLGFQIAMKPKSLSSRAVSFSLAGLIAIPNFVLGLLAVIILAIWLKLMKVLPDWNSPIYWIVAASVLAAMPMASIARVTRASLTNTMSENYVRTARAKGLTHMRVMLVHVLRNAAVPILSYLGPTLMEMFTGLFIVESLYSFPGFGRQYWESVLLLDYPFILGLTLFYAAGIMVVNLLIEIFCEFLDPRIRSAKFQGAP
jgi:oligopeptide transport system permease protein